ncbi:putative F420-0 ABC transporter substrate-binding protein [Georgenia faecalis]|uniref:putative F420-0 ABC transporter substrate-binding protein n=1 Tax=Georgenia faecalis TaxID=2483799 RepID=UPI000FDACFEC|nr:putative F420-0 ABC transporter substrate-binding protein [Georgenia faecalis]
MPRRTRPLLTAALVAGALAACAAPPDGAAPATPEPGAPTSGFPLEVTTCGLTTTLEAPPQRIVTIKSSATELVLALGAGDRLVGTAFADGDLPPELADAAPPVLAEQNPAAEAVLDLEPDLVYAGWESNLSADGAGERAMYEELGVATYVAPAACKSPEHQPDRLTFEHVFDEITEMGRVLGEPEAATELVERQRAELAAVDPAGEGRTALWYSSGSDTPYVGAGIGAPQMLMDAVGLENIAADVADTWTSLSWEAVADRDPDVIVLVDSAWNTAEHKREILSANPVTAALPAVIEERFVVVEFPAAEAGVRNVPAAADLAAQLAALDLGEPVP